MDITKFLATAQKKGTWATAATKAAEGGSFDEIPDGRYVAVLSGAELGESKGSGRAQIVFSYTISEGDKEGEIKRDYFGLEGEDSLVWLARLFTTFGIDPDNVDLTELEATLDDLAEKGIACQLQLKTKNDYQGVRVLKILDDYEPPEPQEDPFKDEPAPAAAAKPKVTPAKPAAVAPAAPAAKPKVKPAPEPEPEPEPTADEDGEVAELQVGMKVSFDKDGKNLTGTVKEIDDATEIAKVRVGLKTFSVSFAEDSEDNMEIAED